jgi:hypothetical protein
VNSFEQRSRWYALRPTLAIIVRNARKRTQAAGLMLACAPMLACHPPQVTLRGTPRKICQLTGEHDLSIGPTHPTVNQTETHARLAGTDLGVNFRGPFGTIFFFFGDSPTAPGYSLPCGSDAVAYARADANPEDCVRLTFYTRSGHGFQPPSVPGVSLGVFEIPTGGFFANGNTYVFFASRQGDPCPDPPPAPTRSYLTRAANVPRDDVVFEKLYEMPARWMLNVSPVLVDDALHASTSPTQVLLFGTGEYRAKGQAYLAKVRLSELDQGRIQYFAGLNANGSPLWVGNSAVVPAPGVEVQGLFRPEGVACMGEFSVAWNAFIDRWLMLYQCKPEKPGQILYRVAEHPWGPWSDAAVLFDANTDGGVCYFMYNGKGGKPCPAGTTNPSDMIIPGTDRADQIGGVYAPYLIDAYTVGDRAKGTTSVYFAMSTWNPYQVVLMRADFIRQRSVAERLSSVFSLETERKAPSP